MSPAPPAGSDRPPRRRVAGQRSRPPTSAPARTPAASAPSPAPATEPADATRPDAAASAPSVAPTTTSQDATEPERRPWWRSRWLLAALAVVTALAVAAAVALFVVDRRNQEVSDARTAAAAAARGHAETILSYDHSTLDEDFAAALAVSTGDFAEEYRTTSESGVRPLATESEAVVEAETVAAGVVSAEPGRVVVLVFVNQTTTSNRLDQPQTDLNRVRMTMVDTDRGWLVGGVDAL